jgi:hypothetical protein
MAKRKRRSLVHDLVYAAAVAATVYVVLDRDNPKCGLACITRQAVRTAAFL